MAKSTGAATPPAVAETPEKPKRQRTSISKEKKIGYMLLSALAVLNAKTVVAVLDEAQKATVTKVSEAAKAIGAEDPFKDTNARINELQKELTALKPPTNATDMEALNKYVAQAKELSAELDRQIKKKAQINELLGK